MNKKNSCYIPVAKPILSKNVKKYVLDAINKNALSGTFGSYIFKFEDDFAKFVKSKFAISTTNGTTALHTAIAALKIGKGDEVLVQTLTNMATAFAASYTGAKIIPIDSELKTCNLNTNLLEKKININTKAIIVVHLFGHPVDMDPVMKIAKKYKLFVIEDCAEAHGAKYKGRNIGTIGDIGCYSFYSNKILSTGEGGMVVTNKKILSERCKSLKNLSYGKKNRFNHIEIGFNYRMSNLTAAVGCAQLEDIKNIIKKKRRIAEIYNKEFQKFPNLILPKQQSYAYNVYWVYHVICSGTLAGKREKIMSLLKEKNIETRETFFPINRQNVYKNELNKEDKKQCPVANYISKNGFYLPTGPNIKEIEINRVVKKFSYIIRYLENQNEKD